MKVKRIYVSDSEYKAIVCLAGFLQEKEGKKVYLGEAASRGVLFMRSILEQSEPTPNKKEVENRE